MFLPVFPVLYCFFITVFFSPFPSIAASVGGSAVTDADHLSHGSADSSSEVNSEEHNVFTHSRSMEDTTDNHCGTGTDLLKLQI